MGKKQSKVKAQVRAAAPYLLEACQAALRHFGWLEDANEREAKMIRQLRRAIDRAIN